MFGFIKSVGHRKGYVASDSLWRRANARKVSTPISLTVAKLLSTLSVDKTKHSYLNRS